MSNVNWDLFKCRCSGISKILANKKGNEPLTEIQERKVLEYEEKQKIKPLTGPQQLELDALYVKRECSKQLVLSDTCISYLMEVYAWETEGMISVSRESMDLLQTKKGKMQEKQAVALLEFVTDLKYKENKDRISNDFLSGEIDIYSGDSICAAEVIVDIKNAWDYPIYLRKCSTGIENGQTEQLQGYGDITGAKKLVVANCLVDAPEEIIDEMRWKIAKKFNAVTTESPDFLVEWEKWERSMKFEKIPPNRRVFTIPVEPFTDNERQKVYDRVKQCREFLWKFDEMHQKRNQ